MIVRARDQELHDQAEALEAEFERALLAECGSNLYPESRYWPSDVYPKEIQRIEHRLATTSREYLDRVRLAVARGIRAREIDAYLAALEAQGQARVIRVEDLGAAMEAVEYGRYVCHLLSYAGRIIGELLGNPDLELAPDYVGTHAASAAAFARRALGEAP